MSKNQHEVPFYFEGKVFAKLVLNDGVLSFEGDFDKSAKAFFDEVVKINSTHIKGLEQKIESLKVQLQGNIMYVENNQ
jgi:hypothetical protein